MWEKLPNLHISVFRGAIEENFVNNKFTFDLNQAQVTNIDALVLMCLLSRKLQILLLNLCGQSRNQFQLHIFCGCILCVPN